jgi:hypothetical protein
MADEREREKERESFNDGWDGWTHGSCPFVKPRVGVWSLSHAGPRAPRGGVTRQGVLLTDLQSLLDCQ